MRRVTLPHATPLRLLCSCGGPMESRNDRASEVLTEVLTKVIAVRARLKIEDAGKAIEPDATPSKAATRRDRS